MTVVGLVVGVVSATTAQAVPVVAAPAAAKVANAPQPDDFGADASTSADVAVNGYGDSAGYHVEVGREVSGFAWHEVAVLHPAGVDDSSWTGYQCVSGDGRFAAVAILPASAVNLESARDHGGFAYSVDLSSGAVRPIATGVGLMYFSPGCGIGDDAVFTLNPGTGQTTTQVLRADLTTGAVTSSVTVPGQVASTVPTATGLVGALGPNLVAVNSNGTTSVVAKVGGTPFDLRPAADGGVSLLDTSAGSTVSLAEHEHAGVVTTLGSGALDRVQLFGGRAGHAVLSGAKQTVPGLLAAAGVSSVSDAGLAHGAQASSLDGDALLGASANGQQTTPQVFATRTAKLVPDAQAPASATPNTAIPAYQPAGATGGAVPETGALQPKGDAAGSTAAAPGTTPNAVAPAVAQSPTCAVPRLNDTDQVMQPSPAQVDWAAQLAEQGLLTTGNGYTRPAGFNNLGLAAYAPNSDFPLIALDHPSSDSWNTVPRSVFEAIMAQESNWSQASWHAPKGVSGDPLIADYYGSGGGIDSISYAGSDCGYGISQVTDGMHVGDTSLSAHGQIKVAVDYEENIAAGLQILESSWNQLYTAGILANNGDPKYLENWYFAAWAYNSGIQPTSQYNSTGCTPGPTCTGADGTWGLGWANNPENPSYPPNRDPYLKDTYADAAHPGNWPYEERVMGWMASPLIRYGTASYSKPTYNGGQSWLQTAPFTSFCSVAGDHCDPNSTNPTVLDAGHCLLNDYECWWHQPVTWIPGCANTCATSTYGYTTGSTQPANPDPDPPTCNQDTSIVPSGSIIVDDETSPPLNIQGCSGENWSSNGSFTYAYGTNSAGDPIGAIDTHQIGTGLGGHILWSHTETGANPAEINTGTWTPNLPKLQYYKIKLHIPGLGAEATNVVYTINPGGGVSPWKIRVNQAWNSEQWVTIGTFAMENGGNVVLTNQSASVQSGHEVYSDFDVAFDAIAFVPEGGTPGQPLGGPPGVRDEPKGSNPAWVQCGCVTRTAGDPVDTSTGYFADTFADLSTPGRGEPLNFTRTYTESIADPSGPNGSAAVDGPFGWGWTYSYNLSASTDPTTGNVTVHQEDGSQVPFVDSSGSYAPEAPRYDATLTTSGTSYVFTRRGRDIFTFDKTTGHLLSEQDLAGAKATPAYATAMAYDTSGHLHTITDPAGRVYTLTWTGSHITQLADSAGRVVTYAYDSNDNLTDVYGVGTTRTPTPQNNDHTQFTYTAAHLMATMRSPNNYGGAVTAMTYDTSERVATQTDALGHATTFAYGPVTGLAAGQTLTTDPAGHKTLDTYANGLLTSETKGYGTAAAGTSTYTYDPVTLGISSETDPDGNLTTYTYDDHGNKTSESNGLGVTTDYEYDNAGDLVETIDGNGVATVDTYDQSGHIPTAATGVLDLTSTTVTEANNVVESTTGNFGSAPTRTTNYYYDTAAHPGDQTRVVDPDGHTTTTTYDAFGDKASTTDAAGNKTLDGYNTGTGWLTAQVEPSGVAAGVTTTCAPPATGCTTYAHDAHGNVTVVTDALGHQARTTFAADGNRTTTVDPNNNTTTFGYDAIDELVKTTAADGTTASTAYNGDGTVADTLDGLSNETSYGYDAQGRRTTRTDPDHRTTTSGYDAAGLVTTLTDPSGRVTTMGYDAAGQLIALTYSDSGTHGVGYAYDPDGNKISMTDGTGTSSWTYDVFGDVTSKTTGAGSTVSYGYDTAGNQTSITYPSGPSATVTQTFDVDNRLATVTDWNSNKTTFGYGPDSTLQTTTYPDGVKVTNGYDTTDTLTSTSMASASGTLGGISYGRDAVGQVSSETNAGATQSYGYNSKEQLTSNTSGGNTNAYAYDAAGNPTTVGTSTQTFDAAGQLQSGHNTTYTFNVEGDRTVATPTTGTATSYGYDQNNRLTSVAGPGGSATYAYDGDGLRASKTVVGTTTTFVWDDQSTANLLFDGTTSYLYGPDGLPIEQTSKAASSWFVHDQDGSTAALLSSTGTVAGSYSYTPYGVATHTGTATTPLEYTGQYTDSESGFIYLRARYYDPATAQFLSVDPQVDSTHAPYAYTNDNPLNGSDPTGECGWTTPSQRSGACKYAMGLNICGPQPSTSVGSSGSSTCSSAGDYLPSCGAMKIQAHNSVPWGELGHDVWECAQGALFGGITSLGEKVISRVFAALSIAVKDLTLWGALIGCNYQMVTNGGN
ncbi:MAG TPA: RHS repeat-associated core domain-containing protein [Pseudonocardiaceae bacterium]|nr:RHS repeat-associated core domain-containing protein [Pseudonocardiaceae bacterium]